MLKLWHSPEYELVVTDPDSGKETINAEALREMVKFYMEEPCQELYVRKSLGLFFDSAECFNF